MTRIAVIGMGGTIAMTAAPGGGVAPALSAEDLIAAVPGLDALDVEIAACSLRSLPSPSVSFADLVALAHAVESEVDGGADGVVITHGTDTIEETAYFLDVATDFDVPVVLTGAMRHPISAGADGPANLYAAVRVAAEPAARGLGALVVMSDEVHGARFVRKTHTSSTAAFVSPGFGPLGLLVEGEPRFRPTPRAPLTVPVGEKTADLRVGLVTVTIGDDGRLLRHAGEIFDGVVLAGLGAGHVPADMVPIVAQCADRVPVVLASRTGSGSVLRATYGYAGAELDLLDRGLIHAGFLDPAKARVLLQLLLANASSRSGITDAFATYR
ncbi:L-asparaginase [Herbihabitans rhizosphaerae]|uniref:L-asparaginase n=1 Tax=Herbihabitans rhizosphaerae TaxID=1872711 RepID=A0A4Q7KC55_9PSEU|nr:asparaginase [Herbihabitans rhizosphaerae]RZS29815.1 L-asparaginase [Herbihabitans rhizosphaerae]